MQRLLVTGATGFIGQRLLTHFEPATDLHATQRRSHEGSSTVKWHTVDLSDPLAVRELFRRVQPSHVLHLAVTRERGDLATEREAALADALRGAIADSPPLTWVHAGSQYEYAPGPLPYQEDAPVGPVHEFGRRKLATRRTLENAVAERRGRFRHLRLFSVFGPYEGRNRFIPSAIARASRGEPIPTTGDDVIHDFVHVDDVVRALHLALRHDFDGAINIGSGIGLSNEEVARAIVETLSSQSKIDVGAYPTKDRDATRCVAAIDRARSVLGWQPEYNFRDGVKSLHRFMQQHPERYRL